MLESVIKEFADDLCSRNGYQTHYDLQITNDLDDNDEILIIGGSTPVICINRIWLLTLMLKAEEKHSATSKRIAFLPLRDRLDRALSKLPKMTRSLSMLTVKDAIALRKGARKWAATVVPQLRTHLTDRFFEVKYEIKVTVTETVTNASISTSTSDLDSVKSIIEDNKLKLSRSILGNEELADLRRIAEGMVSQVKSEVNPIKIHISTNAETKEMKETYEY